MTYKQLLDKFAELVLEMNNLQCLVIRRVAEEGGSETVPRSVTVPLTHIESELNIIRGGLDFLEKY